MSEWALLMTAAHGNMKQRYQILWEAPCSRPGTALPAPSCRADVHLIRCTQAHAVPWVRLGRLTTPIRDSWLGAAAGLACLCHGTRASRACSILRRGLRPGRLHGGRALHLSPFAPWSFNKAAQTPPGGFL